MKTCSHIFFFVYYISALSFTCTYVVAACESATNSLPVMDICSDFRYRRVIRFSVILDSAFLHVATALQIRFMPCGMSRTDIARECISTF